jgi:hypothetical protein
MNIQDLEFTNLIKYKLGFKTLHYLRYKDDGMDALDNISFKIKAGEKIG